MAWLWLWMIYVYIIALSACFHPYQIFLTCSPPISKPARTIADFISRLTTLILFGGPANSDWHDRTSPQGRCGIPFYHNHVHSIPFYHSHVHVHSWLVPHACASCMCYFTLAMVIIIIIVIIIINYDCTTTHFCVGCGSVWYACMSCQHRVFFPISIPIYTHVNTAQPY